MKKQYAMLEREKIHQLPNLKVEVMATVKNYSMIRAKGCTPFVCDKRKLEFIK